MTKTILNKLVLALAILIGFIALATADRSTQILGKHAATGITQNIKKGHHEENEDHKHSDAKGEPAKHDDNDAQEKLKQGVTPHKHEDGEDHEKHEDGKAHKKHEDGKEAHDEDKTDAALVRLNHANIKEAGVRVETLTPKPVANAFQVPGEVKANAYRSALVSPRINSIVISRQAFLGDKVKQGDILATLFSIEMSSAQSKFIISDREWQRVRKLGENVVAARRFLEANVKRQEDYSRLKAYGMSDVQIAALGNPQRLNNPGEFQLLAPIIGTIAADNFKVGQLIEPGKPLFEIIDETNVWVEAKLDLKTAAQIAIGNRAWILAENPRVQGIVRQVHRKVDEHTRTLGVRIAVDNKDGALRPGQFVNVELLGKEGPVALAVPHGAVLRSPDGDWIVFVEQKKGAFKPVEIKITRKAGSLSLIEGVPSGSRVVVAGAFFLQSELAKSGFDIHNH